jgi:hypothetical protein
MTEASGTTSSPSLVPNPPNAPSPAVLLLLLVLVVPVDTTLLVLSLVLLLAAADCVNAGVRCFCSSCCMAG